MKKIFVFVLLAILAIVPSVYAQTCNCEDLQAQIDALTARIEALEGGAPVAEAVEEEAAASSDFEPVVIGDFTVEYISHEAKTAQYTGLKYIDIHYRFTNNSSEEASFGWKISRKAYQNDIELGSHIVMDSEQVTDIRPGKSIEVIDSFKLRDDQSVIELEFRPFLVLKADPVTRFLNLQ